MNIVVIGAGYVGLVTGTCFAEMGINVRCVDSDVKKIENLQKSIIPIYEPGLEELIHKNSTAGRLQFFTNISEAINDAEVIVIAVGTPPNEDGSADLKHVLQAACDIGKNIGHYALIIVKSTVPVGTTLKVEQVIRKELDLSGKSFRFDVASNPEFLKEGSAIKDFMTPDRVIVGTNTQGARKIINKLYRPFMMNNYRIIEMDIQSAEMTKYVANSMLATRISFMNEIANLCEITGADINMVRKGIGSDARIGSKFLYAGIGYGGSCFPKDVRALIKTAKNNGKRLKILEAVEEVNHLQKRVMFEKLLNHFGKKLDGLKIAVWGLSFKPETDDIREAPSLTLIDLILKAGGKVSAFDPVAMNEFRTTGFDIDYARDMYECCIDANAILLATEWKEFRMPSWPTLKRIMKEPVIFDGRNIYNKDEVIEYGFTYYSI